MRASAFLILLSATSICALDWQWELTEGLHYIPSEQEYTNQEIRVDHLHGPIFYESLQVEEAIFKTLQIVYSHIDEIDDGALCVIPFETIRVHGNEKLPKFTKELFGNCPKLTTLYIGSNHGWTFEPDAFSGCENLKSLQIWNQPLVKDVKGLLLPSLVQFGVSHAKLTAIDLALFDEMKKLKAVKLSWNKIDSVTGQFGSLADMRSLDLSENPLMTEFPWKALKKLGNLTTLNLSGSQVTMDVDEIVENVPKLEMFYLSSNPEKCDKRKDKAQDLMDAFGRSSVKVIHGCDDDK